MTSKPHPVLTASEEAREIAETWITNAPAIRMARALINLEEQLKAAQHEAELEREVAMAHEFDLGRLREQLEAANARKAELWTRLLDMENKYLETHEQLEALVQALEHHGYGGGLCHCDWCKDLPVPPDLNPAWKYGDPIKGTMTVSNPAEEPGWISPVEKVIELQEQLETLKDLLRGFLWDAEQGDLLSKGLRDKAREVLNPASIPRCTCTPGEGFGWEGRSPNLKGPGHDRDCPMFSTGQEAAPSPASERP